MERNIQDFLPTIQTEYDGKKWTTWIFMGVYTSKMSIESGISVRYNRYFKNEIMIRLKFNGFVDQLNQYVKQIINCKWDRIIGLSLTNFSIELSNNISG